VTCTGCNDRLAGDGNRRVAAGILAFVGLGAAVCLLKISTRQSDPAAGTLLQAVAAVALSVAIVLGARALDGPIRARSRRHDLPQSEANSAVWLWITCFAIVEGSFLLATLAGGYLWVR
jgi:hypothetical protein